MSVLSNSGLINYGKVTLPSVGNWGTNMNIVKDPPKSIMTKRKIKVGQDVSINDMIDQSGDRSCEAINKFARGVNPSVSVSYTNYGNNGGQRGAGMNNTTHASLPYKIMKDGAFRPPMRTLEELLPVSRQRIPVFGGNSYKQDVDYSKSRPNGCNNRILKDILTLDIKPTRTYKKQSKLVEPFDVKYIVKKALNTSATSAKNDKSKYVYNNHLNTTKNIKDVLAKQTTTNKSKKTNLNNNHLNTENFTQNVLKTSATSRKSNKRMNKRVEHESLPHSFKDVKSTNYTAPKSRKLEKLMETFNAENSMKNIKHTIEYNAPKTKSKNVRFAQKDIVLARNTPLTSKTSSKGGHKFVNSQRSEFKLPPKIKAGGFTNNGVKPVVSKVNVLKDLDSRKFGLIQSMKHNKNF